MRKLRTDKIIERDGWPICAVSYCPRHTRSRTGGPLCGRHEQRLRLTGTLCASRHQLIDWDRDDGTAICERCGQRVPVQVRQLTNRPPEPRCARARLDGRLRTTYGITADQHAEMIARADGRCDACGGQPFVRHGVPTLHVDHDHQTGAVRGLLCQPCNLALGMLADDPDRIRALLAYLTRAEPRDRSAPS